MMSTNRILEVYNIVKKLKSIYQFLLGLWFITGESLFPQSLD